MQRFRSGEGRKFLGANPPPTNFVNKIPHLVTFEIFLYAIGNTLGSVHNVSEQLINLEGG